MPFTAFIAAFGTLYFYADKVYQASSKVSDI